MRRQLVPPWGRVRSWQVRRGGRNETYIVLQLPRNAGPLATNRITKALEEGLEEHNAEGTSTRRRNLYLILTEFARVFRR